jgi:hypothetical protein
MIIGMIKSQPTENRTARQARFTEGLVLESGSAAVVLLLVVGGLELGRRNIANGRQEPAVVEPVDPLQGGVLDLIQALPWGPAVRRPI